MKHFSNIYINELRFSNIHMKCFFKFIKDRNDIVQYVPAKKSHQGGDVVLFCFLAESDTGYNAAIQLYAGYRVFKAFNQ